MPHNPRDEEAWRECSEATGVPAAEYRTTAERFRRRQGRGPGRRQRFSDALMAEAIDGRSDGEAARWLEATHPDGDPVAPQLVWGWRKRHGR